MADAQQRPYNTKISKKSKAFAEFVKSNSVEKGSQVGDKSGSTYGEWPLRLAGGVDPYDRIPAIRNMTMKQKKIIKKISNASTNPPNTKRTKTTK